MEPSREVRAALTRALPRASSHPPLVDRAVDVRRSRRLAGRRVPPGLRPARAPGHIARRPRGRRGAGAGRLRAHPRPAEPNRPGQGHGVPAVGRHQRRPVAPAAQDGPAPAPPPPPPLAVAAEVAGVAAAERTEMLSALDALPNRQREVLLLRYYLDLSESEIAETLGISTGRSSSTPTAACPPCRRRWEPSDESPARGACRPRRATAPTSWPSPPWPWRLRSTLADAADVPCGPATTCWPTSATGPSGAARPSGRWSPASACSSSASPRLALVYGGQAVSDGGQLAR